jgi:tetratricopeptide (TPR) repeat protein
MLLRAQTVQFEQAITALNGGNYQESIDLLEEIAEGDNQSVELYYNLGLSHLKLNHLAEGIANLHRALLISPSHAESQAALDIAKGKISTPITEIPDFILYQGYTDIARSLSINAWVAIQLISLLGVVLLVYILLFKSYASKPFLYACIGAMALMSLWSYTNSAYLKGNAIQPNMIVISEEQTEIYVGADDRSEIVAVVGEGVTARVVDYLSDWIKIELADKDVGWVQKNKVIII